MVRCRQLLALLVGTLTGHAAEPAFQGAPYYERTRYTIPAGLKLEASGLAALPDGRVAVAIRKGEVWILENPLDDPAAARFTLHASGLHEPLGLSWQNGALHVIQRAEVTRLEDRDGDGVIEHYSTVATGWGVSGNYHEYAYGGLMQPDGTLWVTLNTTIGTKPTLAGHRLAGPTWRGWAMRQRPGGALEPVAAGLRSPFGVGTNLAGDVFATDQQGNWVPTGPLIHLQEGRFYGHADALVDADRPESPVRTRRPIPEDLTVAEAVRRVPGYTLPAVWFPYVKMGQSATGILCDRTAGGFGPYAGQLFVGDFTLAQINRVFLERVKGEYQGACFPFVGGMQSAVLQLAFLPDKSMVVGESNRGWNSLGSRSFGLERVRWTGTTPFDIVSMEARSDGFVLTFTEPVDSSQLEAGQFQMQSYTYRYHSKYGSPEVDVAAVPIVKIQADTTGRTVRLVCRELRPGYVHELNLTNVRSRTGTPLWHGRAYYTLNQIPD